ncbi:MAG: hypothetical protein QF464_01120 [Myxococcota bacterium]|jgi:hypothetical protein|nr:hypothetical protein [Myxococcota bacterium]
MALTDDDRNHTQGHVEDVSGELGEYSQVVLAVTVEADQWDTIKGSSVEAAMFVSWLADNIKE